MAQRRFGGQRGQSLVEFALVLPFLAIVIFGLADLGLAINDAVTITNAARDGARVAAVNSGSSTDVNTAVSDDETASSKSLVDCATVTPTITKTSYASPPPTYSSYTVTASCSYTPITPLGTLFKLVGATANSTFTISSSTTMKDSSCTPEIGCH